MLTLKSVQAGYDRFAGAQGHLPPRPRRRGGDLDRRQRRRQDHHPAGYFGLLPPRKGAIEFAGQDLTRMPAERIVTLGLALVPEGRRVFRTLSVTANLELGG